MSIAGAQHIHVDLGQSQEFQGLSLQGSMNPPAADTPASRKSIRSTKTIFWKSFLCCLYSQQLYTITTNGTKPSVSGDAETFFGTFAASLATALINPGNLVLGWQGFHKVKVWGVLVVGFADRTFDMLMGDAVDLRKRFIQTHAKAVRNLDI
jgi:hypothetical protein